MDGVTYHGSCLCEGISFNICGQPEKIFMCYCSDCQKNAGGPYQIVSRPLFFFVTIKCILPFRSSLIYWQKIPLFSAQGSTRTKLRLSKRRPKLGPGSWSRRLVERRSTRNSALDAAVRSGQSQWIMEDKSSSCGRLYLKEGALKYWYLSDEILLRLRIWLVSIASLEALRPAAEFFAPCKPSYVTSLEGTKPFVKMPGY